MLVPAFVYDGKTKTDVIVSNGQIVVKYIGSFCKYTFSGKAADAEISSTATVVIAPIKYQIIVCTLNWVI